MTSRRTSADAARLKALQGLIWQRGYRDGALKGEVFPDVPPALERWRKGGIKTAIFGGEGLFFASITGPGRVWIQTLPFSRLADRIMAARRGDREDVKRDLGGAFGALGDLIGGDR